MSNTSISILGNKFSQVGFNEIDPSFMYSLTLKEIILQNSYDEMIRTNFTMFCRQQYTENDTMLRTVDKFEKNEAGKSPTGWYTAPYFMYQMFNYALRSVDFEIILRMNFL